MWKLYSRWPRLPSHSKSGRIFCSNVLLQIRTTTTTRSGHDISQVNTTFVSHFCRRKHQSDMRRQTGCLLSLVKGWIQQFPKGRAEHNEFYRRWVSCSAQLQQLVSICYMKIMMVVASFSLFYYDWQSFPDPLENGNHCSTKSESLELRNWIAILIETALPIKSQLRRHSKSSVK